MYRQWSPTFSSSAARLYTARGRQSSSPQSQGGGGLGGGHSSFSGVVGGDGGGGGGPGGGPGGGGGFSSRTSFLRRSNNSKSKSSHSSTNAGFSNYHQQSSNFANYQNCTIVRSHAPHANYGYVKAAPKILIFPIFVQVGPESTQVVVKSAWNKGRKWFFEDARETCLIMFDLF